MYSLCLFCYYKISPFDDKYTTQENHDSYTYSYRYYDNH